MGSTSRQSRSSGSSSSNGTIANHPLFPVLALHSNSSFGKTTRAVQIAMQIATVWDVLSLLKVCHLYMVQEQQKPELPRKQIVAERYCSV